jgi:hypothetical protein
MGFMLDQFAAEIEAAVKSYDRHIVCLEKPPEDCLESIQRLLTKAIQAYENRAPGLRHGIALDRHLTIILSETDGDRPLCGIYFNLRSPYQKDQGD